MARFPPNRAVARYLGRPSHDERPFFCGPSFVRGEALDGAPMLYFLLKAGLSGLLAAAISEIARRHPGWGGLVASLPLTSLMAMIWLWRDTGDATRVAALKVRDMALNMASELMQSPVDTLDIVNGEVRVGDELRGD